MIPKQQLQNWLNTLAADVGVSVDEGGLTLVSECGAYLEVGGEPESNSDETILQTRP